MTEHEIRTEQRVTCSALRGVYRVVAIDYSTREAVLTPDARWPDIDTDRSPPVLISSLEPLAKTK